MKKLFVLFFFLFSLNLNAQTKKVYYKDYTKYKIAYNAYVDSISQYKLGMKYVDAVRKIEQGLDNDVFIKIENAIESAIYGEGGRIKSEGLNDADIARIKKGEIIFVNYSIGKNCIVNTYFELPIYPTIKPVYIKPEPVAVIPPPPVYPPVTKALPITVMSVKFAEKDTMGMLMMPDGNWHSVSRFTNQYGNKPLIKIFDK